MPPETQEKLETHEWGRMGPGDPCVYVPPELDRAWAIARISPTERKVLGHVVRSTMTFLAEPVVSPDRSCELDVGSLSRSWCLPRLRVAKALNSLVKDGLVVRSDAGFAPEPEPARWKGGRLSPQGLAYAMSDDAGGPVDAIA